MKNSELVRAVARATGESAQLIKSIGFREVRVPARLKRPIKARRISGKAVYQPSLAA